MSVYLGLDFKRENCCVLHSDFDFETIQKYIDSFDDTHFKHESTNWCGRDTVDRTLKLSHLKLTGRELILPKTLQFGGIDYDMGHEYGWTFSVSVLLEAEEDEQSIHCEKCDNCQNWIDDGEEYYKAYYLGKVINLCDRCCRGVKAMKCLKAVINNATGEN